MNPTTFPVVLETSTLSVDRLLAWYIREYVAAETPADRAAVCRAAQRDGYTGREFIEALAASEAGAE